MVEGQGEVGQIKHDGSEEDIVMVNRTSQPETQVPGMEESLYLYDGQKHTVWTPLPHGSIQHDGTAQTPRIPLHELRRKDILERRKELMNRVRATQRVLRLQSEEHERITGRKQQRQHLTPRERKTWQSTLRDTYSENTTAKRRELVKTIRPFHHAISHCAAEGAKSDEDHKTVHSTETNDPVQQWKHQYSRMASNTAVLDPHSSQEVEDSAM